MAKPKTFKAQHKRRRNKTLAVQALLGITILALLFGISHVSIKILHGQPVFEMTGTAASDSAESDSQTESAENPESTDDAESTESTDEQTDPAEPEEPAESAQEPEPSEPAEPEEPEEPSEPSAQAWNTAERLSGAAPGVTGDDSRMLAVPENGRLSEEYLRTVMFVGDSLSQGFALYPPTREVSTVCAYKSTSPNQVIQNFVGQRPDGSRIEMWDDIKTQAPGSIYVLYGTNALVAQSDEAFLKYYGDLLDMLRQRYPDVPIYVQSITPTTAAQGVKQPPLENGHIRTVNNAIAKMAADKGLFYLDAQEALADAEGNLRGDYVGTYDGIHMNPTGYAAWADYILTHTVYSEANRQFAVDDSYS